MASQRAQSRETRHHERHRRRPSHASHPCLCHVHHIRGQRRRRAVSPSELPCRSLSQTPCRCRANPTPPRRVLTQADALPLSGPPHRSARAPQALMQQDVPSLHHPPGRCSRCSALPRRSHCTDTSPRTSALLGLRLPPTADTLATSCTMSLEGPSTETLPGRFRCGSFASPTARTSRSPAAAELASSCCRPQPLVRTASTRYRPRRRSTVPRGTG